MRPYTKNDYNYLQKLLRDEGLLEEDFTFETDNTYITDIGFFSYRIEHNYPYLSHFVVDKNKRKGQTGMRLLGDFKKLITKKGYTKYITEVRDDMKYMERFMRWLGKRQKPYKYDGKSNFYLIKVR